MMIQTLVLLLALTASVSFKTLYSLSFHPPYSNNLYSCRCLPKFDDDFYHEIRSLHDGFAMHRKMCELRSYLRDLNPYYCYLLGLFEGKTDDIAAWFIDQGQQLSHDIIRKITHILNNQDLTPQQRSNLSSVRIWLEQQVEQRDKTSGKFTDVASIRDMLACYEEEARIWGLSDLFDAYLWFFDSSTTIEKKHLQLKSDTLLVLRDFPFEALKQKIQSRALIIALDTLREQDSSADLERCWKALESFSHEDNAKNELFELTFAEDLAALKNCCAEEQSEYLIQHINCSYKALKDMANIIASFQWYFIGYSALGLAHAQYSKHSSLLEYFIPPQHIPLIVNFFKFFSYIEALQLDQTIEEISRLIKRFTKALADLEKDDNVDDINEFNLHHDIFSLNNEELGSFDSISNNEEDETIDDKKKKVAWWLRSKWTIIPLTVGAVVVKILQHLCVDRRSGWEVSVAIASGENSWCDASERTAITHATKESYVQSK